MLCFESADSTGVMGVFWGSADSVGLSGEVSGHGWAEWKVSFNTPTGSGQAPDGESLEKGKRRVDDVGDEHGKR